MSVESQPGAGRSAWRTVFAVLFFRATREDLLSFDRRHLALGLAFTWVAGIGRYWDNPRADTIQHLGLGSLIYVVALACLLWAVFKPLAPSSFSFVKSLTFLSLTSPPALLYAVPVERYFDLHTAQHINIWFLALVAAWRVALLLFYARRGLGFGLLETGFACLLPLCLIVAALAMLNLEHVIFRIMGGLAEDERSANDTAYYVVLSMAYFSLWAFLPLLIGYGMLVGRAWNR